METNETALSQPRTGNATDAIWAAILSALASNPQLLRTVIHRAVDVALNALDAWLQTKAQTQLQPRGEGTVIWGNQQP